MEDKSVFFSYSRLDASDFALRLAADLRKAGVNIWIDQLDIHGGKRWDTEIQNALKASYCVLYIVSEKSVESENVLDEVSFALNNKKYVIPVIISKCELPYRISRLQQIDFLQDYETGFYKLQHALNYATQGNMSVSGRVENDRLIPDESSRETKKVNTVAEAKAVPSSSLSHERYQKKQTVHLAKKRYLLIGVWVVAAGILAFLVLNRVYINPVNSRKQPVSGVDTGTHPSITEKNINGAERITLAKHYFDNGKVDSGTAILYNPKTKRIVKDEFTEIADSCLLKDYSCYYEKGINYYSRKKFIPAMVFFSLAASSSDKAMCMIGTMYYSGEWVGVNLKLAYDWYKQAEKNNNSVALLMLGIFYMEGNSIPKNNFKAKQYFNRVILNNDNPDAERIAREKLKELR